MQKLNSGFVFCGLFLLAQSAFGQTAMTIHSSSSCLAEQVDQVWVEGAEFIMGDDTTYREEGPAHSVTVSGFWVDAHEVTNAQFAKFVEETSYATVAEQSSDPADWPGQATYQLNFYNPVLYCLLLLLRANQ